MYVDPGDRTKWTNSKFPPVVRVSDPKLCSYIYTYTSPTPPTRASLFEATGVDKSVETLDILFPFTVHTFAHGAVYVSMFNGNKHFLGRREISFRNVLSSRKIEVETTLVISICVAVAENKYSGRHNLPSV